MSQFVAQRIDQTGLFQQLLGRRVAQADPDHSVLVTDPVVLDDSVFLRIERSVPKTEPAREIGTPTSKARHRFQVLVEAKGPLGVPRSTRSDLAQTHLWARPERHLFGGKQPRA